MSLLFSPRGSCFFNIGLGNYSATHTHIYIYIHIILYVHPSTLNNRLQKRTFVEFEHFSNEVLVHCKNIYLKQS